MTGKFVASAICGAVALAALAPTAASAQRVGLYVGTGYSTPGYYDTGYYRSGYYDDRRIARQHWRDQRRWEREQRRRWRHDHRDHRGWNRGYYGW